MTSNVADAVATSFSVEEPFRRYRVDWQKTNSRTDAPDLMGAFRRSEHEGLLREGYIEMTADDEALAEGDMAAGFEALPAE